MTDIDSPENKGLLWNVLLENGSFAGIPETKISEVNGLLNVVVDEVVVGMGGMGMNGQTTMETNKRVLTEMARRLTVYRVNQSQTTPDHTTTRTTTRDDIQKERIDRMNDMAKKMSADMSQYTPPKPKSVRFSDDVDKLSPEILESRLESAIASRNLDMVDVSGGSGGSGGSGHITSDTVLPIMEPINMKFSDQNMHQDMHQDMYQDMTQMYNEMKTMHSEMKQLMTELKK